MKAIQTMWNRLMGGLGCRAARLIGSSLPILALFWIGCAQAEPVHTVLYAEDSQAAAQFVGDFARLWEGSAADFGSSLNARAMGSAKARLQGLRRNRAAFAIVDADTLARQQSAYLDVAAVAMLWPEALHVLVRGGLATALAGPPASDVLLVDSAAWSRGAFLAAGNGNAATRWLVQTRGGVAAALQQPTLQLFVSGAPPAPEVDLVLRDSKGFRLAPISKGWVDQLRGASPWVAATTLPANTYAGQIQPVETVGVSQVLVARADAPAELVRQALTALYRWQDRMAATNPRFAVIDRKANSAAGAWFAFHPVAMKEFGLTPPAPPK